MTLLTNPAMRHWILLCTASLTTPVCAAQASDGLRVDVSLAAPRPLTAGDSVAASPDAYAAPTLADVNGDGRIDLLIGDFGENHGGFSHSVNVKGQQLLGAGAQVQILLGQGEGKDFQFGRSNWASTRDGKVQSPTW